jgi:nicotinamidase-related amidase
VWTSEDCALVLIDYQKDQLESIRSEIPADLIELHTRWLARAAKAFDVPIVLSTIGVESGTNSPTVPSILAELEGIEPIDRTSTDSFDAVIDALKAGYEAQFVTDAVGSRSVIAHRTGVERLSLAGAVPNTALGVVAESFRDWGGPLAEPAREVTGWYLREVPKVTHSVGIAEAEALRANAVAAA